MKDPYSRSDSLGMLRSAFTESPRRCGICLSFWDDRPDSLYERDTPRRSQYFVFLSGKKIFTDKISRESSGSQCDIFPIRHASSVSCAVASARCTGLDSGSIVCAVSCDETSVWSGSETEKCSSESDTGVKCFCMRSGLLGWEICDTRWYVCTL